MWIFAPRAFWGWLSGERDKGDLDQRALADIAYLDEIASRRLIAKGFAEDRVDSVLDRQVSDIDPGHHDLRRP